MRTERIMAVWLVLVVCASAWAVDANDPNLVSYWKFDRGSGTTAYDSAGTNHGTLNGDINWVAGKVGNYALDFDGMDDHVQIDDAAYLDGMDALTVMAWVKTGSTGYMGVIDKYVHHSGNNWDDSYCLHINDGAVLFQYAPGDAYVVKVSSVTVADHSWHHIVGVYTGAEGSIYIDGIDVPLSRDDFDPGGGLNNTSETLQIGCSNNNGNLSEFFVGKIDELAIFNRTLSAQEIEQAYYEGFGAYERAIVIIEDALAEKEDALEASLRAVEKEWLAYESLEELLEFSHYGDLYKRSIVIAKQDIYSAIQHERQSMKSLERSIKRLMYSLAGLGEEAEPNQISE